jgi:hypothetical protein
MLLYVIVALLVVSLPAYIRIRSSPAYRQKATQVVIRQPGQRLLGPPEPIILTGPEDLPFALLSQAAYQRKPDAKAVNTGMCVNADAVLMGMGWKRWEGLDEGELAEKIKTVHLRVEIWWHAEQRRVAVAGAVPVIVVAGEADAHFGTPGSFRVNDDGDWLASASGR